MSEYTNIMHNAIYIYIYIIYIILHAIIVYIIIIYTIIDFLLNLFVNQRKKQVVFTLFI